MDFLTFYYFLYLIFSFILKTILQTLKTSVEMTLMEKKGNIKYLQITFKS